MTHISQLQDIGLGKRCLIVGGGHSVRSINIDDYPDCTIIGTNNHKHEQADIIVYFDKDINEYYDITEITPDQKLIGFKHKQLDNTCSQCTHYYNYDDIVFGDTGFHTLQFADKIFNFSEIYLIGYDYSVFGNSYHHNETVSDIAKQDKFVNWSIGKVIDKYSEMEWDNKIVNLNPSSNLNIFHKKD